MALFPCAHHTLLFHKVCEEQLRNVWFVLICFELVSRLKINLLNIVIILLGETEGVGQFLCLVAMWVAFFIPV